MEKIIERVQKLLALAGNNPNEHEAAAAIEKAHAILADHNLSMQAVREHEATSGKTDADRGKFDTATNFSEKQYAWLWQAVAEAHFCFLVKCRPDPKKRETVYTMIGRELNAVVASQLAMYLCQTVRRLANEETKKRGRNDHGFKLAFIAGACTRLFHRVADLNKKSATANALVVVIDAEQAANQAFVAKAYGKALRTTKGRASTYDGAGFRAGVEAGDKVSLAQQVRAAPEARKIA